MRARSRSLLTAAALLLAALACHDDTQSPAEPVAAPRAAAAATVSLAFWQVSAGAGHTCGLTTDNRAYCWGDNASGELGIGTTAGPESCGDNPACSTRPVAVASALRFHQLSAGGFLTCGLTADYRAYCWGQGAIGDGTISTRSTPTAVLGGHLFLQISTSGDFTCGVSYPERRAYCWGRNRDGQLGDGTNTTRWTPRLVASTREFRQVETGIRHTCGVTTDNRAFCWGGNDYGQLGDSTTSTRLKPQRVVGGLQFRLVDAGGWHTCGVTTTNRAYCWGNGGDGQIGDSTRASRRWPRAVSGGLSFTRVSAGYRHTCGEATTNRAYCWGSNFWGQLGIGLAGGRRLFPKAVGGGLSFRQLSAGWDHTCGKTQDAVVYCWGYNGDGAVGDGTTDSRSTPTLVVAPM